MFGAAKDALPMRRADLRGSELVVMGGLAVLVVWLGIFPGRVLSLLEQPVASQLEQIANTERAKPSGRVFSDEPESEPPASKNGKPPAAIAASHNVIHAAGSAQSRGESL
jgi:hypothetical protein